MFKYFVIHVSIKLTCSKKWFWQTGHEIDGTFCIHYDATVTYVDGVLSFTPQQAMHIPQWIWMELSQSEWDVHMNKMLKAPVWASVNVKVDTLLKYYETWDYIKGERYRETGGSKVLCQPGPRQSGSDLHCIGAALMLTACQSFVLFCALGLQLYLQSSRVRTRAPGATV